MTVYVDSAFIPYGRMKMCHLIATTPAELLECVERIGVSPKHFQKDSSFPHFDICASKRELAIKNGAIPLGRRDFYTAKKSIQSQILNDALLLAQWQAAIKQGLRQAVTSSEASKKGPARLPPAGPFRCSMT